MKIICTEKEKDCLSYVLREYHYCVFLECGTHTLSECRSCKSCIEKTIEWEVTE